jgi:hypothetical protein
VLTKDRRENLLPHVKEARRVVEDAFDRALTGLGLFKDRDPLAAERVPDAVRRQTRHVIDQVLARDRDAGGLSYTEARQRYVEHCAFTLVNRLAALRAMEVRGFLPRSVILQDAQYGGLSAWSRDLLEDGKAAVLGEVIPVRTADEARWQAIRAACAAVATDVGMLFDLQDEYSLLPPEPAALKTLLNELTEAVTEEDWRSDDILGWVYQYYNVSANAAYKERRRRRNYRMTADDMIVANQFYTPHWVVRVLVDNTLGRIWWESIPDLAKRRCGSQAAADQVAAEEQRLREQCRATCAYLVPLPDEQRLGWWGEEARAKAEARAQEEAGCRRLDAGANPHQAPPPPAPSVPPRKWKRVRDLKIIDPACGSGHFLLYVFDVLQRMYEAEVSADQPPAEAVPELILAHNLHGIDVDLRACQLAGFNLYLKARLAYRTVTGHDTFHPSGLRVVCAGARVTEGEHRQQLLQSFEDNPWVKELTEEILNHLSRTAEIGSLLRVREQFEPLLRRQLDLRRPLQQNLFGEKQWRQRNLAEDLDAKQFSLGQVIARLTHFEAEARPSGDVGRLLFAHELAKSCGLLGLLCERYDVALMNPPYGKMPEACKDYCLGNRDKGVAAHYQHTGNNLYAAFMERCIELIDDASFVGMLTSQTFMNLITFKKTRVEILNKLAPPEILCDTGFDVLDGAKVVTAATVLRKQPTPDLTPPCLCIRMFQETEQEKESVIVRVLERMAIGERHPRLFHTSVGVFSSLPGSVYAYWVPVSIARLFTIFPPLDRDVAKKPKAPKVGDSKQGLATGDNLQFTRFFWEVPASEIGAQKTETFKGKPWIPYALGGWLEAFHSDLTCVVNWANDGEALRKSPKARVQNTVFYFQEGLCWHTAPQYPSNQRRMNARLLPSGALFTNSVHAFFPTNRSPWEALGFLNSQLAYYLVRIFEIRKLLNGTVAALPYPASLDLGEAAGCAKALHLLLRTLRTSDEVSPYFVAPAILLAEVPVAQLGRPMSGHVYASHFQWPDGQAIQEQNPQVTNSFRNAYSHHAPSVASLRERGEIAWRRRRSIEQEVGILEARIDDAVYDLCGISPEDRKHISEEIAFRQCQPVPEEEDDDNDEAEGADKAVSDEPDISEDLTAAQDEATFIRGEVTRLLSYAVKLVSEADPEGVIPIVRIYQRVTLDERVKAQFRAWFGDDHVQAKWAEAADILGKPVEDWLAQDYFDFHINMYRRRPIFWQLTSANSIQRGTLPGAFSCLLHYHKLRANTLQSVLTHYLSPVLEAAQTQTDTTRKVLEGLQQRGGNRRELAAAKDAYAEVNKRLQELMEFQRRLQELDKGARPVTPAPEADAPWLKQKIAEVTGGPAYGGRGWLPVIDYGVRVNIEPLKVARILPKAADRIR